MYEVSDWGKGRRTTGGAGGERGAATGAATGAAAAKGTGAATGAGTSAGTRGVSSVAPVGCCGECDFGLGGDKPWWKPPLNSCGLDLSGDVLRWTYGHDNVKPRTKAVVPGHLRQVNQSALLPAGWTTKRAALDDVGWVYEPAQCGGGGKDGGKGGENGEKGGEEGATATVGTSGTASNAFAPASPCRYHVHYHPCGGNWRFLSTSYMLESGLAAYAESNNIVVIFPQASTAGPQGSGCWDWSGAADPMFDTRKGVQIGLALSMIGLVEKQAREAREASGGVKGDPTALTTAVTATATTNPPTYPVSPSSSSTPPASSHTTSLTPTTCSNCADPTLWLNDTVLGDGSLSHTDNVASAADCCAACARDTACKVWTYGDATAATNPKRCWVKNTKAGTPPAKKKATGRVSGFCNSPVPPAPPAPATNTSVLVRLPAGEAVAHTSTGFASFTLDFWPPTQGCKPHGWGPAATVLELDLTSPKLRAVVRAMAPAYLRIGGSLDKKVLYAVPGSGLTYGSADCPAALCLNASRWDQLHAFARDTGVQIVWGLSYPLQGRPNTHLWNASQATALFKYTLKMNHTATMYGFELGEELTKYKYKTTDFRHYTDAYHTCAKLLRTVWGAGDGTGTRTGKGVKLGESPQRPKLMGPCPGMQWPQLTKWFPAFLNATAGALDVAVYHSYVSPRGNVNNPVVCAKLCVIVLPPA